MGANEKKESSLGLCLWFLDFRRKSLVISKKKKIFTLNLSKFCRFFVLEHNDKKRSLLGICLWLLILVTSMGAWQDALLLNTPLVMKEYNMRQTMHQNKYYWYKGNIKKIQKLKLLLRKQRSFLPILIRPKKMR